MKKTINFLFLLVVLSFYSCSNKGSSSPKPVLNMTAQDGDHTNSSSSVGDSSLDNSQDDDICRNSPIDGSLNQSTTPDRDQDSTGGTDSQITKLSQLRADSNGNITIPRELSIEIDTDLDVNRIIVEGLLSCPRSTDSFTLKATGIHISGKFSCGTSASRFLGTLSLSLKRSSMQGMMNRSISVVSGGILELHGELNSHSWQRLGADLLPGRNKVILSEVANWNVGDRVVISSSGFNMHEAEVFTITTVRGRELTLDGTAVNLHKGTIMDIAGHSIDERSSIAKLSRNIVITSDGGDHFESKLGGHVMVMQGGVAQIDSVSFNHLGRMGELGRYPFHWHEAGNVRGQYIKNSVITNSYQRCIVIHKTDEALVENNVCYDHFGHGIFLEHGSERKNVIKKNLALLTKKPLEGRQLLISDIDGARGRFQGPASFWVSNPDNNITDNIAAGSEGSGFWMSFVDFEVCEAPNPSCKRPIEEDTLAFDRNIAHSSKVGITWDGAPGSPLITEEDRNAPLVNALYRPTIKPIFSNLEAYKNSEAGLYFRGSASKFVEAKLADNFWGAFFAYSQHLQNSVIVGHSSNMTSKDKDLLASYYPSLSKAGVIVYDGPFEMENVDFLEFSSQDILHNNRNITPIPFVSIGGANRFENKVMGLNFIPEPTRRVLMESPDQQNWKDSSYSQSIRDLDGSLTGRVNSLVVPRYEFNHKNGCLNVDNWNAYVCTNYHTGLYKFSNEESPQSEVYFLLKRESQAAPFYSSIDLISSDFHNKFNTILGLGEIYTVVPDINSFYGSSNNVTVEFQAEGQKNLGEVVYIARAKRCNVKDRLGNSITSLPRVNDLQSYNGAGFVNTTTGLYFRLSADSINSLHREAELSESKVSKYFITCTNVQ